MTNENLIKAAIMFGGGFAIFMALRPRDKDTKVAIASTSPIKAFDSNATLSPISKENALVVATAYETAMKNGESPSRLTELNKECMSEFGMRCYMDKSGKLIVCDVSGTPIMTK